MAERRKKSKDAGVPLSGNGHLGIAPRELGKSGEQIESESITGVPQQEANSKTQVNPRSTEALKAVHDRKRERTRAKLNAALIRMANDTTAVLKKGFQWTQVSLAAEAGIHSNTLGAKNKRGELIYQTEIDRLEDYKAIHSVINKYAC